MLYSIGYLSHRKYVPFKIKYVDFSCAIDDNLQPKKSFEIWKYNSEYEFSINIPRIRTCFTDYYNSKTSYGGWEKALYGIEANKRLKEYICELANTNGSKTIDDRYTRAFMEHKRMVLLCANKIKELIETPVEPFNNIYEKSCSIFSLSLKFNIDKDKSELVRICHLFDEIEMMEKDAISDLISRLSFVIQTEE